MSDKRNDCLIEYVCKDQGQTCGYYTGDGMMCRYDDGTFCSNPEARVEAMLQQCEIIGRANRVEVKPNE